MGTFTFRWPHHAHDVYVTGTFDDWSKSEKLERVGDAFEKTVSLPENSEKIYYKFVVDGNWTTDHTAPQENDPIGNLNNVLTPDRISKHTPIASAFMSGVTPTSTSADLARSAPFENTGSKDLPGSFPETPANELASFSVSPIPASDGPGNPVRLAAGQSVPSSSTLHGNTVQSTATTDKESYENSGKDYNSGKNYDSSDKEAEAFSVNPIPASEGLGNPIKLAPGVSVPEPSTLHDNTVLSTATTDKESYENSGREPEAFSVNPIPASSGLGNPVSLAAGERVPEPGSMHNNTVQSTVRTDRESYENSSGGAFVLPSVVTPQAERDARGTGVFDLPSTSNSRTMIPESSMAMGSSDMGTFDASPHIQSSGPSSTTAMLAAQVPFEKKADIPEVVKESQEEAGVDPEASANPTEVNEKSQMEKELLSEVPKAPVTSDGSIEKSAYVPAVVKESQAEAGVDPEASANRSEVVEKSQMEQELLSEVPKAPVTSDGSVKPAEAAAAVGAAAMAIGGAAMAGAYAAKDTIVNATQSATQSYNQSGGISSVLPTSRAEAPVVPEVVRESQAEAGVDPEASANQTEVVEKSQMEKELLSEVPKAPATSDGSVKPAEAAAAVGGAAVALGGAAVAGAYAAKDTMVNATQNATQSYNQSGGFASLLPPSIQESINSINFASSYKPSTVNAVPEEVQESIAESGRSPEAAAYEEPVADKSAVERELLSEVKTNNSTGESAPQISNTRGTSGESSSQITNARGTSGPSNNVTNAVPEEVGESIAMSGQSPEAAAYKEPVASKSAMEKELLSEIKPDNSTGDSAPRTTGLGQNSSSAATSHAVVGGVPAEVEDSIVQSGRGAEAAAYKESVAEKSAMERELLSEIKPDNSTGQSAPRITSETTGSNTETIPSATSASKNAPAVAALSNPAATTESRDVSPGTTIGTSTQTQPVVTSGVSSMPTATTTTASAPSTPAKTATPQLKEADLAPVTPNKGTPSSSKAATPASASSTPGSSSAPTDKKKKRMSFFGKLKAKLSDKDKS